MKKTLSIMFFILAGILFFAGIGKAGLSASAGMKQDFGILLFYFVVSGLLIWAGIRLRHKG